MANVKRITRYKLEDTDNDKTIHRKVENPENSNQAYTTVRDRICESQQISISQFEKRYDVDSSKTVVKFADKPWRDGDELRSDIESLQGISNAFYIPPTIGRYGPPAFRIETDRTTEEIREEVNEYYDGLTVEERKESVLVVISPTRHES